MENKVYDVAVIGGGIAGYTAALTLKNFKKEFLWAGVKPFGEKLLKAERVMNFPTFTGNGVELAALLERQMVLEEVPFTRAKIDGVYATGGGFMLTSGKTAFSARSVILATGVETETVESASKYLGRGVSYCAVCDGSLYKNKTVVCELSSPNYAEEAEYLAGIAKKVYAFCKYKNAEFRAENIHTVEDPIARIVGEGRVSGVVTKNGREIEADGVFFLKDAAPPAVLVGGLETDGGHVKVGRDMSTNLAGLFAAGDVTGRPYQYIKAAGEGLVAAFSVHKFLSLQKEIS